MLRPYSRPQQLRFDPNLNPEPNPQHNKKVLSSNRAHAMCLALLVHEVRLGGKSTGKSLLLQNLAERHPGKVRKGELTPPADLSFLRKDTCPSFCVAQVVLVKLRRHRTIVGGLVRVLADLLGVGKDLTKPLPEMFEVIRDIQPKAKSSRGVEGGLAIMQKAEPGVTAIEQASRWGEEKGEQLSMLVDAMIKELGAGKSG